MDQGWLRVVQGEASSSFIGNSLCHPQLRSGLKKNSAKRRQDRACIVDVSLGILQNGLVEGNVDDPVRWGVLNLKYILLDWQ